jgi:hypothetical protein
LAGELAKLGVTVGEVNADVQTGDPHGLAAGVHAGDIAELDECDQR